jgi:hypothetical protein
MTSSKVTAGTRNMCGPGRLESTAELFLIQEKWLNNNSLHNSVNFPDEPQGVAVPA